MILTNIFLEKLKYNMEVYHNMDAEKKKICLLAASSTALLFYAAAIEAKKKEKKRSRLWIKQWRKTRLDSGNIQNMMRELQPELDDFKNYIRMDETCFKRILKAIKFDIQKQNTNMREAISPEEKLSVTLRFLATGESFTDLNYNSKLSISFLSEAIIDVCDAIIRNLKNNFLKVSK